MSVDEMCPYIPDLEDRKHMQALIASFVETVTISDVKTKVIAVSLTLIGNLATSAYEKFCEFRMRLIHAEHHIDT